MMNLTSMCFAPLDVGAFYNRPSSKQNQIPLHITHRRSRVIEGFLEVHDGLPCPMSFRTISACLVSVSCCISARRSNIRARIFQ